MTRFVPICLVCGKGACFGIGAERRDFARLQWWCGACIPPALAAWRKGPPLEVPAAVQTDSYKRIPGGLF
jgi:hypothetical protein